MLKKRSGGVTSKQSLMARATNTKPNLSFFNSPLFTGLSTKSSCVSETDALKSPTSTLDGMIFSNLANPFWSDKNSKPPQEGCVENNKHIFCRGVGLGIVDALNDEVLDQKFSNSKPESHRMVLFGSQLRIQIPVNPPLSVSPFSPSLTEHPQSSPADFGIKTRNSQLELLSASPSPSPSLARKSPFGSVSSGVGSSPRVFTGCLSASEMESSEDYTCVITHGPNPKTTRIFEDCIVEDCCGVVGFSALKKDNWFLSDESSDQSTYPVGDFLSFCYTCKENLGQGTDIFIYRGEKAFCSRECRQQEIMFEEGLESWDDSAKC